MNVITLQETLLSEKKRFVMGKYEVYREDKRGTGGVTAMLVEKRLKHHQLNTPADLQQKEGPGLEIYTRLGRIRTDLVYSKSDLGPTNEDLDVLMLEGQRLAKIKEREAAGVIMLQKHPEMIRSHTSYQSVACNEKISGENHCSGNPTAHRSTWCITRSAFRIQISAFHRIARTTFGRVSHWRIEQEIKNSSNFS